MSGKPFTGEREEVYCEVIYHTDSPMYLRAVAGILRSPILKAVLELNVVGTHSLIYKYVNKREVMNKEGGEKWVVTFFLSLP